MFGVMKGRIAQPTATRASSQQTDSEEPLDNCDTALSNDRWR